MSDWTFIRPDWLWALIPWALAAVGITFYKPKAAKWNQLIAPHLQKQMVQQAGQSKSAAPWFMTALLLALIALAGPSVRMQNTPLYSTEQARVLILDMSLSMWATDVTPNRLTRLRYKAMDYVKASKGGEMGLIAYAGDAFTVSPLTSDDKTLNNLIAALAPEVMPAYGSRPDLAIQQAIELLQQAGHRQGSLILMTDGIKQARAKAIANLLEPTGYQLSIYQIGSEVGAPIKLPSGELLKQGGQITLPTADHAIAKELAATAGGILVSMSTDNSDIMRLAKASELAASSNAERQQQQAQIREDAGPYLLLLILPIFLLLFRKGAIAAVVITLLYQPQPASAFEWQDLWQTQEQRAQQAFNQGDFENAAKLFKSPLRKGAALYKSGDYQGAKQEFEKLNSATGHYNRGNSLAQLQQVDEAIKAYEQALALEPEHQDAKHNLEELKKLKQQQQNQQNQNKNQGDKNSSEQNKDNPEKGKSSPEQNKDSTERDNSPQDENSSEQSNSEPSNQEHSNQDQSNEQSKQNNPEQRDSEQSSSENHSSENKESQQNQSAQEQSEQTQSELQQQMAEQDQQRQQEAQAQQAQAQQKPTEEQPAQQGPVVSTEPDAQGTAEEVEPITDARLEALPDNPAILLRNKMELEYKKRQAAGTLIPEDEVW